MSFDANDSPADYLAGMATDDEIAARVRSVRERAGLSQVAFAKKLAVTRGAVGNWELGGGVKAENMRQIAEAFGVAFEWLATGRGAMETPVASNVVEIPNAIVRDKIAHGGEYIPLYGHAVGGEDGEFPLNGNKLDQILAPPGLSVARGAYAVTCAGESMEPRYFDGETVFVDPLKRPRRGDFVVAQISNGEEDGIPYAYIKRFVRHTDAELVLEQFNPPKELRFPHSRVVSVHFIVLGGRVS